MGRAWMFGDYVLAAQLRAWLASLYQPGQWFVDLFVNDYEPQPGDDYLDYTLPSWPGYATVPIALSAWGPVSVANHVASSTHPTVCAYAMTAMVPPVPVYGYFVSDSFQKLQYAESFDAPVTVSFGGVLRIQPVIRQAIYPQPGSAFRVHPTWVERPGDDHAADDEES